MTNGDWGKEYERGMDSIAPAGKHIKGHIVRRWATSTTEFHRDLPYSLRKRLEYHKNMVRRYDDLVYKHAVKASQYERDALGYHKMTDAKTGFSRGAYHERLADEFREHAAKHALKIVHLMERLGK